MGGIYYDVYQNYQWHWGEEWGCAPYYNTGMSIPAEINGFKTNKEMLSLKFLNTEFFKCYRFLSSKLNCKWKLNGKKNEKENKINI